MKRFTLVLSVLFLALPLFSQEYVNIPDAKFLAALIEDGVDTDEDGKISFVEAEAVSLLFVSNGSPGSRTDKIADLSGIEAFVNLRRLFCDQNNLTSIDLSNNTLLTELNCFDNQLTSLDVSKNDSLTLLRCEKNKLMSLDVSNNSSLVALACYKNLLGSLDISMTDSLRYLRCYDNQLTDLNISNNTALTALSCNNNLLTSLDVTNNTSLTELNCGENLLTSLDLSNNTSLWYSNYSMRGWYDPGLNLRGMPTLSEVCVWDGFNPDATIYTSPPPNGVVTIDTSGSPNVYFTTECTIGLQEDELDELFIYPNPTNSKLTIDLETPIQGDIEIHNLNGQLIYSRPITSTSEQIDISSYAKGIYFVTVRSDAWVRTEKVVKV